MHILHINSEKVSNEFHIYFTKYLPKWQDNFLKGDDIRKYHIAPQYKVEPDNIKNKSYEKNGVKIEKLFISNFIPRKMDPTITVLRSAGVKLFRDFDLYTFFIRLIENGRVRQYFIDKRYTDTIMNFMSKSFQKVLLSTPTKELSQNESAYVAVEIFEKIKEPMNNIFTDNYIDRLKALNYKLFR